MKLQPDSRRNSERGFTAIIVALVLVSVLGVLAVSNGVALRHLKMELDLVEERQWRRHAGEPAPEQGVEEARPDLEPEAESEFDTEEESTGEGDEEI